VSNHFWASGCIFIIAESIFITLKNSICKFKKIINN